MMYNRYEGPTSLNISVRWERVLCYVFGWLSGLVMFIIERENRNVRRHAAQSMLVFGGLNILGWLVGILGSASAATSRRCCERWGRSRRVAEPP